MQISYKPLWHTLLEKGMSKEDLRTMAKLSTNAIANMGKNKNVSMSTLLKICETLQCDLNAVVELKGLDSVKESEETETQLEHKTYSPRLASDTYHPYRVNDAAYKSLIKLLVDICKRNGIKRLVWSTNKSERMNHLNGCNMTVHRDYANKSCPGDYLYNLHGQIAKEVNAQLGLGSSKPATSKKTLYRVRKSWKDAKSQKGAFYDLSNAKKCADKNSGYSVFNESGKVVYTLKSSGKKSVDAIAREVIQGKWGNGADRKNRLTKAGYDYNAIQKRVNEILS